MSNQRALGRASFAVVISAFAIGACSSDDGEPEFSASPGGASQAGLAGRGGGKAEGAGGGGGGSQASSGGAGGAGGAGVQAGGASGSRDGGAAGATASGGGGQAGGGSQGAAGAAGASGQGGTATGGRSSGGAGGQGGGAGGVTESAGCGMPAGQALGQFVEQPSLSIAGATRHWWVQLPTDYVATRAYPVIFLFHGCSNENNNVPMGNVAGKDAILVRGAGVSSGVCWDSSASGPDLTFFDQMLASMVAKRCVDPARIFAAGYSSGSWLINMLECKRGDKLRATGTVSGGTPGNPNNCLGKFARVFVHDADDHENEITGSIKERDRLLTANHCDRQTAAVPEAPAPCARYQGCDEGYPVLWCQTSGKGHDRQDALAPTAFWGVFSKL